MTDASGGSAELPSSGPPAQPAPDGQRRRRLVWVLVGVAVSIVAGATIALVVTGDGPLSDEAQIRSVLEQFADAVDHADNRRVASLLCAPEADQFLSDEDIDLDAPPVEGIPARPLEISNIEIHGDVASAQVRREQPQANPVWLRREGGEWRVCMEAGDQPV